MNSQRVVVLLIEDNPADIRLIREHFSECTPGTFTLNIVESLRAGLEILGKEEVDVILLDLSLPDSQGFETFLNVQNRYPEIPIIILTGFDDEALAIKAVKEGAQDYLSKGHVSSHLLARSTRYAIERKRTEEALRRVGDKLELRVQERTAELEKANEELRREVLERHRAEKAILVSEEKYRRLFEDSRDAIAIVTRDGEFLDINQAGLDLFGYSRSELMAKNIVQLYVNKDDRKRYREFIERHGFLRDYPVRFVRKDGKQIDCVLTSALKYSPDGSVLGYQGIFRDITDYKMAVQGLKESEARYRAIVEDQTELIFRTLPDQTITFVNQAFCRYFGRKESEMLGNTVYPVLFEEDRDKVREHVAFLDADTPVGTIELRVVKPDGTIRWQQWTNRLIVDNNRCPKEVQSVGRDVTEQKQMEEALQKSSEQIKFFAYSVSHDLKSPAISVHGLTRLLHKQYNGALDERGVNYLEQILKSSEQIVSLVETINLYISTKEVSLLVERISLNRILQIIRDEFAIRFSIRSIRWLVPDSLPEIYADRLALLRVLRNLVDNALKYGGENLSEISIGYENSGSHHILSVRDDGVGIGVEDSEKIFDLFQRKEETRNIEGAGLGLAIVREIAEQHGGTVWAKPVPDGGSIFFISIATTLPKVKA
ncbi:PAS domain S-box protein [Desulfogranum japonicum]|uniref:PAS domain S-box protein n=1 Tax=Desulfogranum japonicum TaxID=231447 RepID=UPI0004165F4D|nr:PAS domain S-box protein [Desulfogranum japonicum]